MSHETLIVVPTFNERENIPALVERVLALPEGVDLLIVDDNSPDGTGELADQLSRDHPQVAVLHRTEKGGLGGAYCAGFAWALERDYEFVFEMDGDLSHDPGDIPQMLSLCAARYVQWITGMPFSDPTGGFKCFRRNTLKAINLDAVASNGYSFQIELTHNVWRQGLRIVEVPIIFTDRFQGTSKMSPKIVREALLVTWRLLLQNGLRRAPSRRIP
jgi:dolichol-phosphate mannosyltransferase